LKHASLFSGIGGFDLAAEWMEWNNVLQCEYNEFCQTILQYYWPYATQYKDIKTTDFTTWNGSIDILTGGFPCQPFSAAGKRQGTEDDRHLWPEMLRAIREIKPKWVVGENVGGIVNWNEGLVFEQVQADLETQGYEVQPFILPAAGVNAPHRRDRTWFIAYANSNRQQKPGKFPIYGKQKDNCSFFYKKILPTPNSRDWKGRTGSNWTEQKSLPNELIPTPATRDYKGARSQEALNQANRNENNSLPDYFSQTGKTSQLNPRFVAEMMGFPPDWTELPFQNGETNPSKPTETQ